MEKIYQEIIQKIDGSRVFKDEPMCKHTSLKIGGPADIYVKVNNLEELKYIISLSKSYKVPLTVVGNGSNLLVKDKGIRGITVRLDLNKVSVQDEQIEVEVGVKLPVLARLAYENSLAGLEFASGIPGTVGGAIKMNAGAYGGEFKSIVLETTYLDRNLNIKTISNEEHKFSYRHSIFDETDYIIISTKIKLNKDKQENIKNKMEEYSLKRREKQPLEFPNAGSTFKRKNGYIPAEIVDKCGLKGYNIGDACVSDKHAGFIVNKGKATAEDVIKLIEHIKKNAKEKFNVDLELEIKVIGE